MRYKRTLVAIRWPWNERAEKSSWRSGNHPHLPPLRPGFDPGLVRMVDLILTPRVFFPALRFFFLLKNQLSLLSTGLSMSLSGSGDWVTIPNVPNATASSTSQFAWRFEKPCVRVVFHLIQLLRARANLVQFNCVCMNAAMTSRHIPRDFKNILNAIILHEHSLVCVSKF